ncbi:MULTISPECIES: hypothetical protein [Lactobacillus]|uniref:Surface layer protein A domain-containing protein n=1 Tax=Lactobacillus xujianguonis TaxID=2495899 RepID=A0A437STX7_9LACO|nr:MULTISPECIES: hypothetical protein [Lactobacillus]RVU70378.1 hypothetical protein EJK17_08035 [Lactobacillus xujianguonis]RVU73485.1 hypothetical protein EJK20_07975 [Lactobacillus xujianguonis]
MLQVKGLIKVVSSLAFVVSLAGMSAPVVQAETVAAPLGSAEIMPTDSSIKKGQKIMVVVKDTKKQTVAVYNKNAKKTNKTVKMGSEFTAKAVKKVNGKKIVKVAAKKWLNTKDVAQN